MIRNKRNWAITKAAEENALYFMLLLSVYFSHIAAKVSVNHDEEIRMR